MIRSTMTLGLVLALGTFHVLAQAGIKGQLLFDNTVWAPVVYLSHIQDLDQMHAISYRQIIAQVEMEQDGSFSFSTDLLPKSDQLYRVHLVKRDDPPATLIIGGRDHNHFFFLAKRGSKVRIEMTPGPELFNDLTLTGYGPNRSLQEIDAVIERLNAVDQVATSINRDFTREVIYNQLRAMADSCKHPLTSLYALFSSNYKEHFPENPAYYRRYFRNWSHEKSEYYLAFRHQLDLGRSRVHPGFVAGLGLLLVIMLVSGAFIWRRKNRNSSPYADLTIQERRVFDMLKEGRSNKEIAEAFSVSVSTVKSHVNSIFSKLGVNSRRDIMDL